MRQRPAQRGFGRDVQHHGAVGRAAHAAVGDAQHVLDAGARELHRDGQGAGLGHARGAQWADVLQHQHVVGVHVEIVAVDACGEVGGVLEDDCAAAVFHQPRVGRGGLDERATRREVAVQHGDAALCVNWIVKRPHHALRKRRRRSVYLFAQAAPRDGERIKVQQRPQLAQQRGHATGVVEVLHVVLARGLEVEQHRGLAAHAVECMQVDIEANSRGDGGEVDHRVGRAADGQQHAHGVLEGGFGEDLVDGEAAARHLHRHFATALGNAHALGRHRRWRRAAGHRHAQGLGDAGHGAGRAHHRAGADAGHELLVDSGDLFTVDVLGTKACPVAAAVGAGADALRAVRARQHRPGDELHRRQARRGRAHQLRRHRLVATADQHHGVHRLRAQHLLGVHGHEVAQVHAGGLRKAFVQRDGGEGHRQATRQHDAALHRFDELHHVAVAGVVGTACVDDADDGALQGGVAVARAFDEGLAQEERELAVAVARQATRHALRRARVLRFRHRRFKPSRRADVARAARALEASHRLGQQPLGQRQHDVGKEDDKGDGREEHGIQRQ